ncbi:MAG: 5-dehydro-4-deoxy-D-glucuronate isomerase [Kiritimatiellia bacterium]
MRTIEASDRNSVKRMNTSELRENFVISDLFIPSEITTVYTNVDRAVVGGIVPVNTPLEMTGGREMACDNFCDRREAGIINLGASGVIEVDGNSFELAPRECLYIGKGSKSIIFTSADASAPAQFYLVSYPAHAAYPTTKAAVSDANIIELGSDAEANRRTLYQYICPGFIKSCQLVMGFTELHEGNVWNTFPPHTHDRRTEVYCYFDLTSEKGKVLHLMGEPDETRHLTLTEKDVTISPPWSIHSGVGTCSYAFVWGMGGENQVFSDMDHCDLADFR